MAAETIDFAAGGGTAPGYRAAPPGDAKGPAVVVLHESWGRVDSVERIADRLAAEGLVALAPDLYHGDRARSPEEAGERMQAMDVDGALTDIAGATRHLLQLDRVAPKRVAVLGFGMGGQLALHAACELPGELGAAVMFYGGHPHLRPELARLAVPVQCHWGSDDDVITPAAAKHLVAQIEAIGVEVESCFYDAGHSFCHAEWPEAYDAAATAQSLRRTVGFLRRHLG